MGSPWLRLGSMGAVLMFALMLVLGIFPDPQLLPRPLLLDSEPDGPATAGRPCALSRPVRSERMMCSCCTTSCALGDDVHPPLRGHSVLVLDELEKSCLISTLTRTSPISSLSHFKLRSAKELAARLATLGIWENEGTPDHCTDGKTVLERLKADPRCSPWCSAEPVPLQIEGT